MHYSDVGPIRTRGFTVLELLVAVAIVGLLIALLLPAVQAAREAARRAQCINNLAQIGIGLHTYVQAYLSLPPGRFPTYDPRLSGSNPPCTSPGVDKSFLVMILPYVEQEPLYNSINQSLSIFGYENRTCFAVSVGSYACPSDSQAGLPRSMDISQLLSLGLAEPGESLNAVNTSYVGCFGSLPVTAFPRPSTQCKVDPRVAAQANGCFNDISPITFASVSDGLSSTLFVTERSTTLLGSLPQNVFKKYGWYFAGNLGDTLFTSLYAPNFVALANALLDPSAASSQHPAGVNALMGDGSARFIKQTISSWQIDPVTDQPVGAILTSGGWWENLPPSGVWQALTTRNGGELISADSY
jgi:prepilin-type N-terminal cleavage/methylation domain-containing protein